VGSNPTPAALQAGFRVAERFTAPDGARTGASAQALETASDLWNVAPTGASLAQIRGDLSRRKSSNSARSICVLLKDIDQRALLCPSRDNAGKYLH
jgi:hypothetical protein